MHLEGTYNWLYFLLFRSRLAYNMGVLYVEGLTRKGGSLRYTLFYPLDLICKCSCRCE